jgi:hypothetical protein
MKDKVEIPWGVFDILLDLKKRVGSGWLVPTEGLTGGEPGGIGIKPNSAWEEVILLADEVLKERTIRVGKELVGMRRNILRSGEIL